MGTEKKTSTNGPKGKVTRTKDGNEGKKEKKKEKER
jgi:hypothetical protein